MMNYLNISIVIPTFNPNQNFDELIETIVNVMQDTNYNYEIIIVNDGSEKKDIWNLIIKMTQKFKNVRGINLAKNTGQQKAIICGLSYAKGDLILTMDDDFKHNPRDIPHLIGEILSDDNLMCVNCIYTNESKSLVRNLGSRLFDLIAYTFYSIGNNKNRSSFRIMRKNLLSNIINFRTRRPQVGPIIMSLTDKIKTIFIENNDIRISSSRHKFFDFVSMTFDSLIYVSNLPIRFFTYIGISSLFISLFLSLYFLISWYFSGSSVPGFTSQVLLILFFGGLSLSTIGIIGIYVFRILDEITGPHTFLIKDFTDGKDK